MTTTTETDGKTRCTLKPLDLNDPTQYEELRLQRVQCGWFYQPEKLDVWRREMEAKTKALFWIMLPADLLNGSSNDEQHQPRCAGHISLDSDKDPPDHELANPDKSVLEISTMYILPRYRRFGLATSATLQLERWAKTEPFGSPHCKAVTVNTLSKRYLQDDSEEWRGVLERLGMRDDDMSWSREEWYERLGFVKFKEQAVYEERLVDGRVVKLWASFMRKEI
jgi:GNAT superfamily N-acetyltransferase